MVEIHEDIQIGRSAGDIFKILIDIRMVPKLSEYLSDFNIVSEMSGNLGSKYSLKREIHGIKYFQEFEVTKYTPARVYQTKTTLFGFKVTYTYKLNTGNSESAILSVVKSAKANGMLRIISPLLKHVFIKPEHDAAHLNLIRFHAENQASASNVNANPLRQ